jgi:PKHD-type hydroxylase
MVRDDARRQLLFDLDTSIETLRRTNANADAVLQLTNVYHNLLRGWAEV